MLFTSGDSAVLLIDHQLGTMTWARSAAFEDVNGSGRIRTGRAVLGRAKR
ncbi:hypothetical protein ABH927_003492 [Planotetraspora sp. GP83]